MKSTSQDANATKVQGKQKATFTSDTLEPRILMSATWIDSDTAQEQIESVDIESVKQVSQIEELLNGLGSESGLFDDRRKESLFDESTNLSESAGAAVWLGDGNDTFDNRDDSQGIDFVDGEAGNDIVFTGGGDDVILGDSGDDRLYGESGNDLLDGGENNDFLDGGTGDDNLTGGSGDDYIVGGEGTDSAVYRGALADYKITQNQDGTLSIADRLGEDRDGSDTLSGVEKLVFADGEVSVENLVLVSDDNLAAVGADGNYRGPNLLVNGGLEANQTSGWSNRKDVAGWQHINSGEGIEVWADGFLGYKATEGSTFIELDSDGGVDGIFQNVQTTEGRTYELTFDAAKRGDAGAGSDTINVYWNGEQVAKLSLSDPNWTKFTFTVVGTGGEDRLEFRESESTDDGYGGLMDNVQLRPLVAPGEAVVIGGRGPDGAGSQSQDVNENIQTAEQDFVTVDDEAGITDPDVGSPGGETVSINVQAGESIPLELSLPDSADPANVEIRVSGLPAGAQLSAGVDIGQGEWRLTGADLESLSMSTNSLTTGNFDLRVTTSIKATDPIHVEDFEQGASGWNLNHTETGGTLGSVLGRFGGTGGQQAVFKSFPVPKGVSSVVVEFDFLELDTWDGESFLVFGNDDLVINDVYQGAGRGTDQGGDHSVALGGESDKGFSPWTDQKHRYRLVLPVEDGQVKIGFGSTLNQSIADESFAIDNLMISANSTSFSEVNLAIEPAVGLSASSSGDLADGPVSIELEPRLAGVSELQSVRIENVPTTTRLSVGRQLSDGSWELTAEQVMTLQVSGELEGSADLTIRSTFKVEGTLYQEDFEKGASGWNSNSVSNRGERLTSFLGGFNDFAGINGGGQNVFKTFSAPPGVTEVLVQFDFLEIDSWDGEQFRVFGNDQLISAQSFTHHGDGYNADLRKEHSVALDDGTKNQGVAGWPDQRHRYTLTIPVVNGEFKLGFGSTLDQHLYDESWGIDNLKITASQVVETTTSVTINSRQVLGAIGGDNTFVATAKAEALVGRDGIDTIDFSKSSEGVTLKLDEVDFGGPLAWQAAGGVSGDAAGDTYVSIENVIGSAKDDYVYGAAGGSNVMLGDGNDVFDNNQSRVGNDVVDGGRGDDVIWTGRGDDTLMGGEGNDRLYGEEDHDKLYGGKGNDYLDGGAGNDVLEGGTGNDALIGGAGDDVIDGGEGFDSANFSGKSSDYEVTRNADGSITVKDTRPGSPDGTDRVVNVETLVFADSWLPIDTIAKIVEPVQLDSPSAEPNQLTIRLGGEMGNNAGQRAEPPRYEIWANGEKISTGAVDWATLDRISVQGASGFQELKLDVAPGQQLNNVSVRFINDAYEGKASTDRNLYVDAIEVNGKRFEAEGPNVKYHRGGDEIRGQETMAWSGTLSFNTSDAPRPIDARIAENVPGAVIGKINMTGGGNATYTVSDDRFEIEDGNLKLKDGVSLDFEAEASVELKVTATEGGLSWIRDIRIDVEDINEAPAAVGDKMPAVEGQSIINRLGDVDEHGQPAEQDSVTVDEEAGETDREVGSFTGETVWMDVQAGESKLKFRSYESESASEPESAAESASITEDRSEGERDTANVAANPTDPTQLGTTPSSSSGVSAATVDGAPIRTESGIRSGGSAGGSGYAGEASLEEVYPASGQSVQSNSNSDRVSFGDDVFIPSEDRSDREFTLEPKVALDWRDVSLNELVYSAAGADVATSDGFDTSAPLGESSPNRKESVGPFADPEKSQELSKFWSLLRAYGGIRSKV